MEERMSIAQEAAIGFARQLHKEDQAEIIDFDSQVRILAPFTNDGAALEKAIRATTANGSTSLYNALYISLKELRKTKASSRVRHPPSGDRAAVRRRRHVEPDRVRRGARSRQAIRDVDLRDRPAAREKSAGGSSRKRSSSCGSSRRRRAARRSSRPTRASSRRSTRRSGTSSRASMRSATRRATRSATAPGAASSCGSSVPV